MVLQPRRIILNVAVSLLLLLSLLCSTPVAAKTTHVDLPSVDSRPIKLETAESLLHHGLRKLEDMNNNQDDIYDNEQNEDTTEAEYNANYYSNDDGTTSNNNNSTTRTRKSGTSMFAILFLAIVGFAIVVLCIFAPICCYPLSLWDIVSVYCHWEKCHTGAEGSDYMNVCDGVVVI